MKLWLSISALCDMDYQGLHMKVLTSIWLILASTWKPTFANLMPTSYGKLGFPNPPDTRPVGCHPDGAKLVQPQDVLVTIVVPYLNEQWDYMHATLRSLLFYTPDKYIHKIVFVSDGNRNPRTELLEALSPKLKVLVLPQRLGLIRAKMRGAELVETPVVVFLEAHCIVNRRWLEPLLLRLESDPKLVAMPTLDAISQGNFRDYRRAAVGHFRLEWNFNLIYTAREDLEDSYKPYSTPATSAGIFAMNTHWFRHLELFDTWMKQWGGDHVELSMKAWRCGGRIEIIPCSRVGHMFRDAEHTPYPVKIEQIVKNYARLAHVWTDNHIEKFFKVKPEARTMTVGNISRLLEQRVRLGCKDMEWYLENVDIELGWEAERICIPGAALQEGGCASPAVAGRSTIDQLMPAAEYFQVKGELSDTSSAAQEKHAEERSSPPLAPADKWEAARVVDDEIENLEL